MSEVSKVLIVEDEYIIALDVQTQIEKLGHSVIGIATTGRQAIELANETRPDIVLMDIQLRGEYDGIETAIIIRKNHGIPIIYLTAFADATTLERASITQPFGYILKPYQAQELEAAIQMALYKRQVEKELNKYVNQLNLIMEHATDGFVLVDSDMNILRMNRNAENFLFALGYSPNTPLISIHSPVLVSFLSGESREKQLNVEVSEPCHRVFEFSVSKPFESYTDDNVPASSNPARLLIIRDITMQLQLQRQREEHARMTAIGKIVDGISQEFNDMLGTIITRTYLVKTTQPLLLGESLDHLESIREYVIQAAELIAQLKDFSQNSQLEMSALNLSPLMKKLMELVERTFPASISIQYDNEYAECWITGDSTRLAQAVMNIMLRANEEMPIGGHLNVMVEKRESSDLPKSSNLDIFPNHWYKITVQDTGKSIAPENLSKVFDPVMDIEHMPQGFSPLLAEVKHIVTQHKGHIDAKSTSDATSFEIYLPADRHN